MKKINKILPVMIGIMTIGFALISCKSGSDSKKGNEDSLKAAMGMDSAITVHEMQMDSTKKGMVMIGRAKPNPDKKRGKGTIVLQSDWEKEYEKRNTNAAIEMDKEGIYNRAEIKPSFPGGEKALAKFIQDNIVYPETAIDNGVEGTVEVIFAVDENGKVYTPRLKGVKEGYGLDEASLTVVGKMPKWNPGQIKGKNVKSYYSLPISFVIN